MKRILLSLCVVGLVLLVEDVGAQEVTPCFPIQKVLETPLNYGGTIARQNAPQGVFHAIGLPGNREQVIVVEADGSGVHEIVRDTPLPYWALPLVITDTHYLGVEINLSIGSELGEVMPWSYAFEERETMPSLRPYTFDSSDDDYPANGYRSSVSLGEYAIVSWYHGELWRTDGTAEGTFMLRDFTEDVAALTPDERSIVLQDFARVGGGVVFSAPDSVFGTEPWFSDGTVEGTRMVANLVPEVEGSSYEFISSRPQAFADADGIAVFAARNHSVNGNRYAYWLHITDGQGIRTVPQLVYDYNPSQGARLQAARKNDYLYLAIAGIGIVGMTTNGDDMRLLHAETEQRISGPKALGQGVVYGVEDESNVERYSLWTIAGSNRTPKPLAQDKVQGVAYNTGGLRFLLLETDGRILFLGEDSELKQELWITNGTSSGTVPLTSFSQPDLDVGLTVENFFGTTQPIGSGYLYFSADDGNGHAVWSMDLSRYLHGVPHAADTDSDYIIDVSELLRVIQFYNAGGLHVQEGTEDGYAPGPGSTDGMSHDSDYLNQDWEIELSELLRAVQLYNAPLCNYCVSEETEDGFAV